mmetsp:Transcript_8252/g.22874  ORF Transcript_8252/g.22874 Transcript_8252/m.22874 type:complete len:283 (+) Transcript_8252:272-1120(+)
MTRSVLQILCESPTSVKKLHGQVRSKTTHHEDASRHEDCLPQFGVVCHHSTEVGEDVVGCIHSFKLHVESDVREQPHDRNLPEPHQSRRHLAQEASATQHGGHEGGHHNDVGLLESPAGGTNRLHHSCANQNAADAQQPEVKITLTEVSKEPEDRGHNCGGDDVDGHVRSDPRQVEGCSGVKPCVSFAQKDFPLLRKCQCDIVRYPDNHDDAHGQAHLRVEDSKTVGLIPGVEEERTKDQPQENRRGDLRHHHHGVTHLHNKNATKKHCARQTRIGPVHSET